MQKPIEGCEECEAEGTMCTECFLYAADVNRGKYKPLSTTEEIRALYKSVLWEIKAEEMLKGKKRKK